MFTSNPHTFISTLAACGLIHLCFHACVRLPAPVPLSLLCAVWSEVYEASSLIEEDKDEEQDTRVSLGLKLPCQCSHTHSHTQTQVLEFL